MRRCLDCDSCFVLESTCCDNCGKNVLIRDGIERHVDADVGGGFDKKFFKELVALEAQNFWFKARNNLIANIIEAYANNTKNYLEIGCGTGYVLERVAKTIDGAKLSGSEYFSEGLVYAKQRVPKAKFLQIDGRDIPFNQEFDLIGAYDVLEHIDDDERA